MKTQISIYTSSELRDRHRWPRRSLLQKTEEATLELDRAKKRMARFNRHLAKSEHVPHGYALTETEIKLREADLVALNKELDRRSGRRRRNG